MERGRFILLEGGEGAGKSTLIERLKQEKFPAVYSREPGGTPWGEELRKYITDPKTYPANPESRIILNTASRFELLTAVVKPALAAGQNAILDRSWPSAWAYNWRVELDKPAESLFEFLDLYVIKHRLTVPDLVCWLDIEPAVGLERGSKKKSGMNEYDKVGVEFHQRIRQAYQELYDGVQQNVHPALGKMTMVKIDASQSLEAVYKDVRSAIDSLK